MDHNETLLEIGAVARRQGMSEQSVRRAEAAGRLPKAIRLESGRRVWRASDFDHVERARPVDLRSTVRSGELPTEAA